MSEAVCASTKSVSTTTSARLGWRLLTRRRQRPWSVSVKSRAGRTASRSAGGSAPGAPAVAARRGPCARRRPADAVAARQGNVATPGRCPMAWSSLATPSTSAFISRPRRGAAARSGCARPRGCGRLACPAGPSPSSRSAGCRRRARTRAATRTPRLRPGGAPGECHRFQPVGPRQQQVAAQLGQVGIDVGHTRRRHRPAALPQAEQRPVGNVNVAPGESARLADRRDTRGAARPSGGTTPPTSSALGRSSWAGVSSSARPATRAAIADEQRHRLRGKDARRSGASRVTARTPVRGVSSRSSSAAATAAGRPSQRQASAGEDDQEQGSRRGGPGPEQQSAPRARPSSRHLQSTQQLLQHVVRREAIHLGAGLEHQPMAQHRRGDRLDVVGQHVTPAVQRRPRLGGG